MPGSRENELQRHFGLIGVGLVGIALAERCLKSGWAVCGHDISADRMNEFQGLGGRICSNADDVFTKSKTIVVSLPTSEIAATVLDNIHGSLHGKTIIDTTTGAPEQMISLGQRLTERGATYLDATIAGSSAQVRLGEVVVMIGGDDRAAAEYHDFFGSFASRSFHVGPIGAGARMKLVVNLVLGLNRAVIAEGLCFAERFGVDPRKALEVLQASPAYSRVMDTKATKMLDGDFTLQARLAQHSKDIRLILNAGKQFGAKLPLSNLHEMLLNNLIQEGYGDLDNSAIVKAFQ
jgi:3-hydroxyisobutyrate dehydrogenase-like beta-hydroxyacid dehydrogenase